MGEPRPAKVAVVDEVHARFAAGESVVLTEYRGLDVGAMAELRRALRPAGGEYKIYKNTLVRRAASRCGLEIDHLLTGPTAIAFVVDRADGSPGDPAAVARALRDFARIHNALVLKGGVLDARVLGPGDVGALAELPSREAMLARVAAALAAPMTKLAGLLAAVPRDFAYGLQALIDAGGASPGPADPAEPADTNAISAINDTTSEE